MAATLKTIIATLFSVASCTILMASASAQTAAEALKLVQWLESQPCPKIAQPLQIKSLLDESNRAEVKEKNFRLAKEGSVQISNAAAERSRQLAEFQRTGSKPSQRLQRQIDDVEGAITTKMAQISMALVQWSQTAWIDMALINPVYPYDASKPHPLAQAAKDGRDLLTISNQYKSISGANELIAPIQRKYATCLVAMQNVVIDYNAIAISDLVENATAPGQLQSALGKYSIANMNFSAYGNNPAPVVGLAQERIAYLNDIEAQEREKARIAAQEARRERERLAAIEREKQCEAGKKAAQKNLALAKTFVRGVSSKNINTAASVMHADVVINSPSQSGGRNVSRGILRAKQRLQSGFNDNSGGSTKTPYMSGCGSISAGMVTSRGRATMRFEFSGGKITEVYIQA